MVPKICTVFAEPFKSNMRWKPLKIIVAGSQNEHISSSGYFISYFYKPNINLNDCQNEIRAIVSKTVIKHRNQFFFILMDCKADFGAPT